jgi:hypothetical protein
MMIASPRAWLRHLRYHCIAHRGEPLGGGQRPPERGGGTAEHAAVLDDVDAHRRR